MIRTIREALSHPMYNVVKREEAPGIFQIRFGKIPTIITIKICPLGDCRFVLEASHGIKTELQAGAYWVRHRVYSSPGEALDDFRSAFSIYYRAAEECGFRPSPNWLVKKSA
jgi:hypothetical protein